MSARDVLDVSVYELEFERVLGDFLGRTMRGRF